MQDTLTPTMPHHASGSARIAAPSLASAILTFMSAQEQLEATVPPDDDISEEMYGASAGPAAAVLAAWDSPATTVDDAVAALRFADDLLSHCSYEGMPERMVSAALGYLERTSSLLSIEMSGDIASAVSAIEALREGFEQIQHDRYDAEVAVKERCGDDRARYLAEFLAEVDPLIAQEDAFSKVELELENFIRVRTCRTLGDFARKLRQGRYQFKFDTDGDQAEYYANENLELLRSIVPWVDELEKLGRSVPGEKACQPTV